MDRLRKSGDEEFRSVAIVLAVLGSLAFLSFVMAGVVGAWDKSQSSADHASITSPASR